MKKKTQMNNRNNNNQDRSIRGLTSMEWDKLNVANKDDRETRYAGTSTPCIDLPLARQIPNSNHT